MPEPLRGAVIGCGFFADNHLNAWAALADATIVAVCDRDPQRLQRAREKFAISHAYADAATMLAEQQLDFVDIVTTVASHRQLVELCASHGIPVICQKPFALDLVEARAMVYACATAGVPLLIHENFRWQAPIMAVQEVVRAGTIGRPRFARISFRHGFDVYGNQPYLAREERLALIDVGVHVLDLARFHLGEVSRLYCRNRRVNPKVIGEDQATLLLDHVDGAVSIVDISFATRTEPDPFPQCLVTIEGDAGTVALGQDYQLVISDAGGRETRSVEPPAPPWAERPWHVVQDSVYNLQAHWLDCLRRGTVPQPSGADNLRTLDLTFKAYESAASGQAIAIDAAGGEGGR